MVCYKKWLKGFDLLLEQESSEAPSETSAEAEVEEESTEPEETNDDDELGVCLNKHFIICEAIDPHPLIRERFF